MLYFAFGLNLIQSDMLLRIPRATVKGPAILPGHMAFFTLQGYATVIPVDGAVTQGLLWEIPDAAVDSLDRFENVESGLYRRETVELASGEKALVYVASERRPGVPRPGDLKKIRAAGVAIGWTELPISSLQFFPEMEFRIPGMHRKFSGRTVRDLLTKLLTENRHGASSVNEWKEWAARDHIDVQVWSDEAFLFSMIALGAIEIPSAVDGPLTVASQR